MRDALAFAARGERPYVAKHIADTLASIDNIIDSQDIIERMEDFIKKEGDKE